MYALSAHSISHSIREQWVLDLLARESNPVPDPAPPLDPPSSSGPQPEAVSAPNLPSSVHLPTPSTPHPMDTTSHVEETGVDDHMDVDEDQALFMLRHEVFGGDSPLSSPEVSLRMTLHTSPSPSPEPSIRSTSPAESVPVVESAPPVEEVVPMDDIVFGLDAPVWDPVRFIYELDGQFNIDGT